MKQVVICFAFLLVGVVSAEREPTIGEYAADVRSRVVAKVKEALATGAKNAEVTGIVTYSANGCFFLQKGDNGLKVFSEKSEATFESGVKVSDTDHVEMGMYRR